MKVPPSETTGEAGVQLVGLLFTSEFGWLFRRQLESDFGIDAQVEVVAGGAATGRLLALQVKSGASYLRERTTDGFVFRPDRAHVDYWMAHSLPVAIVLADVDTKKACWQQVSRQTLVSTGAGWKLVVPYAQLVEADAGVALAAIADADPYIVKLRQLQLAKPWMQLLEQGGRIVLDVEEWVNKTSGRAALQLTAYDKEDEVIAEREWPWLLFPFADYAVELPRLFPWAALSIDSETYEEHDLAQYELECGIWDSEDQRYFFGESFEEWSASRNVPSLRPYTDDGEVAYWRLNLSLGEFGAAFLKVDRLLEQGLTPLA